MDACRSVHHLLGFESTLDIIGIHASELTGSKAFRKIQTSLSRQTGMTGCSVDVTRKDGSHIPIELNSKLIYEENGEIYGVESLVISMADRRE